MMAKKNLKSNKAIESLTHVLLSHTLPSPILLTTPGPKYLVGRGSWAENTLGGETILNWVVAKPPTAVNACVSGPAVAKIGNASGVLGVSAQIYVCVLHGIPACDVTVTDKYCPSMQVSKSKNGNNVSMISGRNRKWCILSAMALSMGALMAVPFSGLYVTW
jgi:hypothetical protein